MTTLPDPYHFDIDDDPEWAGGNGYNDETEIVALRPDLMQAATDYRFESYFSVYSEAVDRYFAFTSQESEASGSEYNVATYNGIQLYQTHKTRLYPW